MKHRPAFDLNSHPGSNIPDLKEIHPLICLASPKSYINSFCHELKMAVKFLTNPQRCKYWKEKSAFWLVGWFVILPIINNQAMWTFTLRINAVQCIFSALLFLRNLQILNTDVDPSEHCVLYKYKYHTDTNTNTQIQNIVPSEFAHLKHRRRSL